MIPPKVKAKILWLHRLVGLVVAPVLLLVVLSGAVLAWKPILGAGPAPAAPVDVQALRATLAAVDPESAATRVRVLPDGQRAVVEIRARGGSSAFAADLATHARAGEAPADLLDLARKLHRELLVGVELPVTVATFALLALALLGPFIAWPRRRNTLGGWHTGMGWFLWPLLAVAPITGVMLTLHLGAPSGPKGGGRGAPGVSIAAALELAERGKLDLRALRSASKTRGGVVFVTAGAGGTRTQISADGKTGPMPEEGLAKRLHEGTWGGAISGGLSFATALATLAMMVTGVIPWARRKLKKAGKGKG